MVSLQTLKSGSTGRASRFLAKILEKLEIFVDVKIPKNIYHYVQWRHKAPRAFILLYIIILICEEWWWEMFNQLRLLRIRCFSARKTYLYEHFLPCNRTRLMQSMQSEAFTSISDRKLEQANVLQGDIIFENIYFVNHFLLGRIPHTLSSLKSSVLCLIHVIIMNRLWILVTSEYVIDTDKNITLYIISSI